MTTRLFWLSFFNDANQPIGSCIVEVDDDDVESTSLVETIQTHVPDLPVWMGAALRKSHEMGCNPGGNVSIREMLRGFLREDVPLNRLMKPRELKERGLIK